MSVTPLASAQIDVVWTGNEPGDGTKQSIDGLTEDVARAPSPLQLRRQMRRLMEQIQTELSASGYLDPKVETALSSEDNLRGEIAVDAGKRFTIDGVSVDLGETQLANEILTQIDTILTDLEGRPAVADTVIRKESELVDDLREAGYAFAEADERRVIGDRDAATISVTYRINTGPRIRFGQTDFPTDIRTKASYLERLVPYANGELYTPDQLALLNRRLSETRLFDRASARLSEDASEISDDGSEVRRVIVELEERPRNTLALGGSFSTAEGVGVNAQLTRRNIVRRGDVLDSELTVAQLERSLTVEWRRPNEFGYGRGLVLNAGLTDETTDAFDRRAVIFGAGYEVVEGPDFSWSYGATLELVREESEQIERDLQLATLYAGARIDRANDLLDPTAGWRAEARISPHQSFGDSEVQFVRATGQIRNYLPLGERFTFATRLRAGAALGAELTDLPSDDRYYAGGGGSVRGYAFQAIGPRDVNGEPLGGRALLDGSLELRWQRSVRLGFVGFVDAGSISPSERPSVDDIRVGAGLGVRYGTPAGPIRFDVAVPLDRTEFDDPVQIYISIGQAF